MYIQKTYLNIWSSLGSWKQRLASHFRNEKVPSNANGAMSKEDPQIRTSESCVHDNRVQEQPYKGKRITVKNKKSDVSSNLIGASSQVVLSVDSTTNQQISHVFYCPKHNKGRLIKNFTSLRVSLKNIQNRVGRGDAGGAYESLG